jgi:hypothetical protein
MCLVAGGHRQQHRLEYEEAYAAVCSCRTMRMILAVSAHENVKLQQFDALTAFLIGMLEEVHLRPPVGAEHLAGGRPRDLQLRSCMGCAKPQAMSLSVVPFV